MTKSSVFRAALLALGALALSCTLSSTPALAQHGGGHGGGGGHAGGGAARGGGGFSGGGARSAPGYSGGGFYRQPSAGGGRYGYGGSYRNPNSAYGRAAQAPNPYRSQAPGSGTAANRDGQWHSFGGGTNSAQSSAQVNGNWQSFAGPTRGGATAGVRPAGDAPLRSFAGQGSNIRETTPQTTVAANFAGGTRPGLGGSAFSTARIGGSPALSPGLAAHNFIGAGFNSGFRNSAFGGFGFNRFGFNRFGYGRFGYGRFGYGFGYPFFGFGWPWWGLGLGWNSCPYGPGFYDAGYGFGYGYDPFAYDYAPCTGLWGTGYGPWSYSAPYQYYPDDEQLYPYAPGPEEQGPPGPPEEQGSPPPEGPEYQQYPQEQGNPPAPSEVNGAPPAVNYGNIGQPPPEALKIETPVELFLKSGGVFDATIYWIANDKLNYVTENGAVITIDIDQLDLQRTISENARRGVPFTLNVQGNNVPPPVESAPPAAPPPAQ